MAIYTGETSHKPSKDHPAGHRRMIEGATDNPQFAALFSRSGSVGRESSNAKLQVIDLYSDHSVFIDPDEMTRSSEMDFLEQHKGMVSNFRALGRYMLRNNRAEMDVALHKFQPSLDINRQSDAVVIAVAKLIVGLGSQAEVSEALTDQDPDRAYRESLYRVVKGRGRTFLYTVHGIDIRVAVRLTGARLTTSNKTIKLTYKVVPGQSRVIGSKSMYTRKADADRKNTIGGFSKIVRDLANRIAAGDTNVQLEYGHRYDYRQNASDVATELLDKTYEDFRTIGGQIQQLFEGIEPAEVGAEHFDDFNPASAIRRLWNELGFAATDIPINVNEFSRPNLKFYADGRKSAQDLLHEEADVYFLPRFQAAMQSRFQQANIDSEALAEIMVSAHRDDWRGLSQERLMELAVPSVTEAAAEYADSFKSETSIDYLVSVYRNSNKFHEDNIIRLAAQKLLPKVSAEISDSNAGLKSLVEGAVAHYLTPKVANQWADWLEKNHATVSGPFDTHLDSQYLASDNVQTIIDNILIRSHVINEDNVVDFARQASDAQLQDIDQWFNTHFDKSAALNQVRELLREFVTTQVPYRKVDPDYWTQALDKLNGLDDVTAILYYGEPGNEGRFIDKFAADWEEHLTEGPDARADIQQALDRRLHELLQTFLTDRQVNPNLFKSIVGDLQKLMGPTYEYNANIISNLYPAYANTMTVDQFVDQNLQPESVANAFFVPGYEKLQAHIKDLFAADRQKSKWPDVDPKIIFPAANAYASGLITYDEYLSATNPGLDDQSKGTISREQFTKDLSAAVSAAIAGAMLDTGVPDTDYDQLGQLNKTSMVQQVVDGTVGDRLATEFMRSPEQNDVKFIDANVNQSWAAGYFRDDINKAQDSIRALATNQLVDDPKIVDAFKAADLPIQIPTNVPLSAIALLAKGGETELFVTKYIPKVAEFLDYTSDPTEQNDEDIEAAYNSVDDQMMNRIDHENKVKDYVTQRFQAAFGRFPAAFNAAMTPEQFDRKVIYPLERNYLRQMKAFRDAHLTAEEYQNKANTVVDQLSKGTFSQLMEKAMNLPAVANAIREKVAEEGLSQSDHAAFLKFLQSKPDQMFLDLNYSLDDLVAEFKGNSSAEASISEAQFLALGVQEFIAKLPDLLQGVITVPELVKKAGYTSVEQLANHALAPVVSAQYQEFLADPDDELDAQTFIRNYWMTSSTIEAWVDNLMENDEATEYQPQAITIANLERQIRNAMGDQVVEYLNRNGLQFGMLNGVDEEVIDENAPDQAKQLFNQIQSSPEFKDVKTSADVALFITDAFNYQYVESKLAPKVEKQLKTLASRFAEELTDDIGRAIDFNQAMKGFLDLIPVAPNDVSSFAQGNVSAMAIQEKYHIIPEPDGPDNGQETSADHTGQQASPAGDQFKQELTTLLKNRAKQTLKSEHINLDDFASWSGSAFDNSFTDWLNTNWQGYYQLAIDRLDPTMMDEHPDKCAANVIDQAFDDWSDWFLIDNMAAEVANKHRLHYNVAELQAAIAAKVDSLYKPLDDDEAEKAAAFTSLHGGVEPLSERAFKEIGQDVQTHGYQAKYDNEDVVKAGYAWTMDNWNDILAAIKQTER